MTTEERAREISESFYRPETGYSDEELYMSAMAMAEWKDRQYLALLDTLIKSGADPQIVHDFIVINDIDVDQIIL